jgi:hypothetical protein
MSDKVLEYFGLTRENYLVIEILNDRGVYLIWGGNPDNAVK